MRQFFVFTGRNLKLYFRDRGAVFFSLLSMLIVIALMVFFLGDMNIDGITELLSQFPGRDVATDEENAKMMIYYWTCAGIISINAVTVTLAVYSTMIKDRISGKLNSIYTSPVNRAIITASYIATAWVAAVVVCVFTMIITELYGRSQGVAMYSASEHFHILGTICLNAFLYAAIMYLFAMLAKTEGAWSGIGTVVGTLVGFLGGIYIPVGTLSGGVQTVIKGTPIIYSTALFRSVMLKDMITDTFAGVPEEVVTGYREVMGIDIKVMEHVVKSSEIGVLLFTLALLFVGMDVILLKYGRKADR